MKKNYTDLYDLAKDLTLEYGYPYTDPRTGVRTNPAHTCVDNPDLVCPACKLAEMEGKWAQKPFGLSLPSAS